MATIADRDLANLHHKARVSAGALLQDLERAYQAGRTEFRFKLFEGYRSPKRQLEMLAGRVSKAGAWQSSHQYGLAMDLVPDQVKRADGSVKSGWTWQQVDWDPMHEIAHGHGWRAPISWDKPHVEHPLWLEIKKFVL